MHTSFWQIVALAIVQGIAEFLPISSSGHVVILATLLGVTPEQFDVVELNIFLHLGTFASIIAYYWREILRLLTEDRRVVGLLVLGTLPAVAAALILKATDLDQMLESPLVAAVCLLATGGMLLWTSRQTGGDADYRKLPWLQALGIGVAQAVAILPGISRSGTTIAAGLTTDLKPQQAATFSFLLALPAILGAVTWEVIQRVRDVEAGPQLSLGELLGGALIAAVIGYVSIALLIRVLEKKRLHYFAWWCFAVGGGMLIYLLAR
ncbi:undecaprenyl-diphosphate phosphatase [Blastopirellula sp. JC732]|uniref:Undecaprenyl-diphosphatase n=1 Tax=Blastopirellula sediminis TaxID=2894196 RepID=A0A9X1MML0_9BACT|nr:undecaprenyl-diphosphate phosphatase [Blastopirellula sediminis]MCC9607136.1 undecaprenyl-diphosphate phosphatase [Blastopirellula sediminis]MCC9629571.1 undecaprenyl-diphosphate phosphatase [Blastopirellula sediminis]